VVSGSSESRVFSGRARAAALSNPDSRVARVKFWLVRSMLVSTALSLIATSDPTYFDEYATSVTGPNVVLSADAPRARFQVTVRAETLFEATKFTNAALSGSIRHLSGATFVRVTSDEGASTSGSVDALSTFDLSNSSLEFEGNCAALEPASPCESSFVVSFERAGAATPDSREEVQWHVEVSARVRNESGPDGGPFELPWAVEVTPLD
jgi:hypothetical protein